MYRKTYGYSVNGKVNQCNWHPRKGREDGVKPVFTEIIAENFLKLIKDISPTDSQSPKSDIYEENHT